MSKDKLLSELKELNKKLENAIYLLKEYQGQRVEDIETDRDIKEYKMLKTIVKTLEEVA